MKNHRLPCENYFNMKTAQILFIEKQLEMLATLGRAYFSEQAQELKIELLRLRQIEVDKQLKLLK